jgi:hypothetical protein
LEAGPLADIESATWSETAASNNAVSPNGWKSGTMLPSEVEPVGREMMAALKRDWDHKGPTVTSGGAANVQTLTYSVAPAAYVAGQIFTFIVGFTNTGSTTLNVNALGAKTIQKNGANLVGNELKAGGIVTVAYDGTVLKLLAASNVQAPATFVGQPANPGSTNSTTRKMMGLGATCKITPSKTGIVVFQMEGYYSNTSTGGLVYLLRYGTGSAPANGDAVVGSSGLQENTVSDAQNGIQAAFSTLQVVTGLTVGTQYWFDLHLATVTTGFASVAGLNATAFELS